MKRIILAVALIVLCFSVIYAGSVTYYRARIIGATTDNFTVPVGGVSAPVHLLLPSKRVKVTALKIAFMPTQISTQADVQIYEDLGMTRLKYEALNVQLSNDTIIDEMPFWLTSNCGTCTGSQRAYLKLTNDGGSDLTTDTVSLIMESMYSNEITG